MTEYRYNNNVPAAPDDPADDQPYMLTNTQSVDGILGEDHVNFNKANGGYHKIVHLVAQSAAGIPLPTSSLGYLWVRTDNSYTGNEDLWYRGGGLASGTAGEIQMTLPFKPAAGTIPVVNPPSGNIQGTNGFSFLPGGILIQWGNSLIGANLGFNITFSKVYNAAPPVVLITPVIGASSVDSIIAFVEEGFTTTTGFRALLGGSMTSSNKNYVSWLAIGQALPPT